MKPLGMVFMPRKVSASTRNVTALLLQMSLAFSKVYMYFFFIVSLSLFIYKGKMFPYPPTGAYTWDIIFLCLYYIIERTRLFLASKGNKTKQIAPMIVSLFLAIPILLCNSYYLEFQTYVIQLERVLNGIAIAFVCAQVLLSIWTLLFLLRRSQFY